MKIISIIKRSALLIAALAVFVGCNEPDPDSISVVDITTDAKITTIYAGSQSGEYYYKVLASEWSVVSSDEEWCIPQKDAGTEYGEVSSIYVRAFSGSEDSRTATLLFRSGVATQTILVSQVKSDELINLYPSSSTINYKAQSLSFMVDSNFEWEASSSVSWVKCTTNNDNTVSLSVEENESSTQSREAVITVIAYNDENGSVSTTTATYTLTQEPRSDLYLTPSISNYTFTYQAGLKSVELFTNIYDPAYTVSVASQSDDEWCSVTYSDEDGLVITATANSDEDSRSAIVSVIARSDNGTGNDTVSTTINVSQEGVSGPVVTLGMSSVVYDKAAGNYSINYYANCSSVVVTTNCEWITGIVSSSNGVSFSVSENLGASTREAELTITAVLGGTTIQETITVYQNGIGDLDLQISPDYIEVDDAGQSDIKVLLTTNTTSSDLDIDWIFATEDNWVSVEPEADSNNVMLSVTKNTSMYERTCYVVVKLSAGDQTVVKSVTVYQKGASLDPSFD